MDSVFVGKQIFEQLGYKSLTIINVEESTLSRQLAIGGKAM